MRGPLLFVGIGGAGSRIAEKAAAAAGADCLRISNDPADLGGRSVRIGTGGVINPSVRLIRAGAYGAGPEIEGAMSGYNTVVMAANLAGRAGAAAAPVVSEMCGRAGRGLVTFAVMPFGYEKGRIFESGIALRRLREGPGTTIVVDNDSMMQSNPDLAPGECYDIADAAIVHVARSLGDAGAGETGILAAGRGGRGAEESLRDSLKALYGSAPPGSVRRSMMYVMGGGVPVGEIDSVSRIAGGILGEGGSHVDAGSDGPGVVMLASIRGTTKFDGYDPLGAIPAADTLDWQDPECSIDCGLDLYQME